MKRAVKFILFAIGALLIFLMGAYIYYLILTANISLDQTKFTNTERIITFFDTDNNAFLELNNGNSYTELENTPKHLKNAFISIEDKRFYSHNGIDVKRLFGAGLNNLKSLSFKEGGSTITQQLIKNTHLSSEKTIKRKLSEIKLAMKMEKVYSKDEILELYLNTIYFGDNCYGITSASNHYFGKEPKDLTINECAILSSIIKAPSYYSPFSNPDKCFNRKNVVLSQMFKQNYITESQLNENSTVGVDYFKDESQTEVNKFFNYEYLAKTEFANSIEFEPYQSYNITVHTAMNKDLQQIIEKEMMLTENDYKKTAVLINSKGQICAYYSNCNQSGRQIGSIIKPLLVYAPAIENNVINTFTKLNDEKMDFNGYSPSNYQDKYYGKITVKDAIAKSSNVCAVSILNCVGIKKSLEYVNKTNIPFTENDNSLCLALGATEKGASLIDLTSAYTVFNNKGNFLKPHTIKNHNENSNTDDNYKVTKIFENDTISLLNDTLRYTVTDGTAKKLSYLNFPLYAKTGTVGSEKGNTDAYIISYNKEFVLGVWVGNKENEILPNNVTGGSLPANIAYDIWSNIYKEKTAPNEIEMSNNVSEVYIDKIIYDKNDRVVLADKISPERFKLKVLMKKSNLPKEQSDIFSNPKIEIPKISVKQNEISVILCLAEYYNALIYKDINGEKIKVFDTAESGVKTYTDKDVLPDQKYKYYVVPYFKAFNEKNYYGTEIVINTIKTPSTELGEDWWNDDLE